MRKWIWLLAFAVAACAPASKETPSEASPARNSALQIGDADIGTYVVLDRNHAATEVYYRLSRRGGKWVMYGKQPGSEWANISCDSGCDYRASTPDEARSYFPADWLAQVNAACIQNIAQAFCCYTTKDDATKGGYVVMALVAARPIPLFLLRVPKA